MWGGVGLRVAQFLANFWHGELIGQLMRLLAAALKMESHRGFRAPPTDS